MTNTYVKLPAPSSIDASKHLFDTFGSHEKEVTAGYIIRLAQRNEEQGHIWKPFTEEEIESFYNEFGHTNFCWNGLDDMFDKVNDTYCFSTKFITLASNRGMWDGS